MRQVRDWTSPADVRIDLARHWEKGRLLRAALSGEPLFPLSLRLSRPETRALSDRFDEVRTWIKALEEGSKPAQGFGYVIEWDERNLRQLGSNRVPASIAIPSEEDALRLLGKQRQMTRFRALAAQTLEAFPELHDWLLKRPLEVVEHEADWPRILAVLRWFRDHQRCGIYVRQIDIPDVDTKFIEIRKGLLSELLDCVLPADAIDQHSSGARNFERRYGLRGKPAVIRFRILDSSLSIHGMADIATPAAEFATLRLPVERVFITENEVNGLAFPDLPNSLVIFGLGYGLERLAEIQWLREKEVQYWGDLDTHGFWMLDRLRARLPHARSLLMDRETLLAHRVSWVKEAAQARFKPIHLDAAERALYEDLASDRFGESVRLEQERVSFGWLQRALEQG